MRCPSCQRPVDHEANTCYSCGYSSVIAMKQFGGNQVVMQKVHDAADCLRVSDSRDIRRYIEHLESRFTQLLFVIYLGELNESIPISELGFWLLNQAKIEGAGNSRPNDNGILLILDVEKKQVGVSLGYLTETLLSEEDCLRALMVSRSFFINGEFGDGVIAFLKKVEKLLLKRARKMKGLTREEKLALMNKVHHGPNTLVLPGPSIPVQFDPNADQHQEHGRATNGLIFRNEFENERK